MKREVEREVRLRAFDLTLGDLELLWGRMLQLFEGSEAIEATIALSLPSEKLAFQSLDELKAYDPIRGRVTSFRLELRQDNRAISISTGGIFNDVPTLRVRAENDLWCAGAIQAAEPVIGRCRTWYWWLIRVPFLPFALLAAFAPWLKLGPFREFPNTQLPLVLSWFLTSVLLAYISYNKQTLLPAAAITFSQDLGFVRRYGAELGLLLGILSILLAIYMWIVPYGA